MIWKKIILIVKIILFAQSCICLEIQEDNCELNLQKNSFFAPLIFTENGILKAAQSKGPMDVVKLATGENVLLSCAPNYFGKISNKKFLTAKCISGGILEIDGQNKNFLKDLACEMRVVEEILKPVTGCPSNETSTEYGIVHPLKEKSYILGETCYSEVDGRTLFIHFKAQQKFKNEHLDQVALRTEDKTHFSHNHPMSQYKLEFLKAARIDVFNERLSDLLDVGSDAIPVFVQDHLMRENLLVNQQFYSVFKLAWNYVMLHEDTINVLDRLEFEFRTDKTIDVYIGTHGVAKMNNVELYLTEGKRFPIPKYVWMFVKVDNEAVALALLNDKSSDKVQESLCNNICNRIELVTDSIVDKALESGRLQCCEYKEFVKVVDEMPRLKQTFDLLT